MAAHISFAVETNRIIKTKHGDKRRVSLSTESKMRMLSFGVSKKEDERRVPIHPDHLLRLPDIYLKGDIIRRAINVDEGVISKLGILSFKNRVSEYQHCQTDLSVASQFASPIANF